MTHSHCFEVCWFLCEKLWIWNWNVSGGVFVVDLIVCLLYCVFLCSIYFNVWLATCNCDSHWYVVVHLWFVWHVGLDPQSTVSACNSAMLCQSFKPEYYFALAFTRTGWVTQFCRLFILWASLSVSFSCFHFVLQIVCL